MSEWADIMNARAGMMQDPPAYGKRWWFIYFWKEAVARADSPGALEPSHVASPEAKERFKKGAQNAQARLIKIYDDLKGDTPQQKLDGVRALAPIKLREILTELLRMGCRGVPVSTSAKNIVDANANADNIISCCSFEKDNVAVEVGWRSELRPFWKIRLQEGTKRQVDVDSRAAELHMNATWHPYSQEEVKKYLWYRAGLNNDNCFYSVISVGLDFRTVLSFPEMDSDNFPSLPRNRFNEIKSVRSWDQNERANRADYIAVVRTTTEPRREFLATKVHAYMFLLKGLVLDTRKAARYYGNDAFPEKGVTNIALDDIYACFPVLRVFHEEPSEQDRDSWICRKDIGFTAFIGPPEYVISETSRRCRYSDEARQKLDDQLRYVMDLGSAPAAGCTCAWSGSGNVHTHALPSLANNGKSRIEALLSRF